MTKTILTGIEPTGRPRAGNLRGAIRPALQRATGEEGWMGRGLAYEARPPRTSAPAIPISMPA